MTQEITVHGLDELVGRMSAYPVELTKVIAVSMNASLVALKENVPPYPPELPDSTYRRTGTLGKEMGSIYTIRNISGGLEGIGGSNLNSAAHVIGETSQAKAFVGRWWTMATIANKAADKINKIWQSCANLLAQFLEGKK